MRVLILQSGFNEIGVIEALKEMGHYVISIGNQKGLIGQRYVDEYYPVDYSEKEKVLGFMLEHKIDYICACCNDTAVLTAAYVAEMLHLKRYDSYQSVSVISNKNLFKRYAAKHHIDTTEAKEFSNPLKARNWVKEHIQKPLIVKPVDLSGGKGVSKCSDLKEAAFAIENALNISKSHTIIIEPFIDGTQHGFCTFLVDKKVVACCSNDEYSVINPYRVEIDTFPATGIEHYQETLIRQIEQMAEDLSLTDGIFHLQYIEKDGEIYILETMRRIIGNMYAVPASRSNDFDWDYWEAKAGIGLSCVGAPERKKSKGFFAYRALIPPKNGVIKKIVIDEELKQYIFRKDMFEKAGDHIENYRGETVGILFFEFENREQMERIMLEEYDRIQIIMEEE